MIFCDTGDILLYAKLVLCVFMAIVLTISSSAIIVKLVMVKKTKQKMQKFKKEKKNILSYFKSKTNEYTETSLNMSSMDTQSSYADNKTTNTESSKAKKVTVPTSKADAINNMIVVLSIATLFFDILYLTILINRISLKSLRLTNNIARISFNNEIEKLLMLIKFSITGLLFFVSGEIFRGHLYSLFKFCTKKFKNSKLNNSTNL